MKEMIRQKSKSVEDLAKEIDSAKMIGIVSLEGLPSSQLQTLRHGLKGIKIYIRPKNVMKRALEKLGFGELANYLTGSCAIVTSTDGAFTLSVKLGKNRAPAFAKEGQLTQKDIIIEAGPTPFMPGPMMTEMTELGIKAAAKQGKLAINEPATLAKKGSALSRKVAAFLFKMSIKAVSTGLELLAALENGKIFKRDELIVDVDKIINDLVIAYNSAINLAYNADIVTPQTIEMTLRKAFSQAKTLAREAGVITNDNVGEVMFSAKSKAEALASAIKWEVK